jgi:methylmalonyl-CoA/ethylmalonyl-CoA epimerase
MEVNVMGKKLFPPLGHVGIIVANVDESVKSYAKLFGAANFAVYDFEPVRAWCNGAEMPEYKLRIGMGSLDNGTAIELIQPITAGTLHDEFLRRTGGGLHHIAFYTEEFEWWRQHFMALGAKFVFEAEINDSRGYRRCFYAQELGTDSIIEFAQIPIRK